jgi:hypothetical protein
MNGDGRSFLVREFGASYKQEFLLRFIATFVPGGRYPVWWDRTLIAVDGEITPIAVSRVETRWLLQQDRFYD